MEFPKLMDFPRRKKLVTVLLPFLFPHKEEF
jgi:hypothetical protein